MIKVHTGNTNPEHIEDQWSGKELRNLARFLSAWCDAVGVQPTELAERAETVKQRWATEKGFTAMDLKRFGSSRPHFYRLLKDQIQEYPERHQKLQHLHDLMVDQAIKALETEEQPNASMLRTCLEVLKANDVDVNALEEKSHQPGHALAEIKLPFDSEGNRVN